MDAKQEFADWFQSCIMMRDTVDKEKCQDFGGLRQGFLAVKKDGKANLIPFHLYSINQVPKVIDALFLKIDGGKVAGIFFCSQYLSYTTPIAPKIHIEGDEWKSS